MKSLADLFYRSVFLSSFILGSVPSAIALGAEDSPAIADGQAYVIQDEAISITPPLSWQILPKSMGKTLLLQAVPKQEAVRDLRKPTYNRNITVAVMHQPNSMDETTALKVRQKLEKGLGELAGVTEFQIVEHRFIDYREKADGLLIYTAFKLNGFPMSQMHIFLSGSENSVLLTYTDLADAFQNDEQAMTLAWNAMLSTELKGKAPKRYEDLVYMISGFGLFGVAAISAIFLRRRSMKRFFIDTEERLYRGEATETSGLSKVTGLVSVADSSVTSDAAPLLSDVWNLDQERSAKRQSAPRRPKQERSAVSSY